MQFLLRIKSIVRHNRTILRNLILLSALSGILVTVWVRPGWASEIVFDYPCTDVWIMSPGGGERGAECTGASLCYSEVDDSLSIITNRCWETAYCPSATRHR